MTGPQLEAFANDMSRLLSSGNLKAEDAAAFQYAAAKMGAGIA